MLYLVISTVHWVLVETEPHRDFFDINITYFAIYSFADGKSLISSNINISSLILETLITFISKKKNKTNKNKRKEKKQKRSRE